MAIAIEDGTGIRSALAYGDNVGFKAYHQARGNTFSGGGGDIDKACIRATDYIENRFGRRFKGTKCFVNLNAGQATLSLTSQPLDTETVTIGSNVYTFQTTLTAVANNVQIGANVDESIINLARAVNGSGTEGVEYGAGTVASTEVESFLLSGDRMLVKALTLGTGGNGLATTETLTGGSWNFPTTVGGGDDGASQPLSFPRRNLVDRDGQPVLGIPEKLKAAMYEYALRALTEALNPDPEFNDSGRVIKKEKTKVGPIEEEFEYEDNGQITIRVYPAADALLQDYVQPAGGVIR